MALSPARLSSIGGGGILHQRKKEREKEKGKEEAAVLNFWSLFSHRSLLLLLPPLPLSQWTAVRTYALDDDAATPLTTISRKKKNQARKGKVNVHESEQYGKANTKIKPARRAKEKKSFSPFTFPPRPPWK